MAALLQVGADGWIAGVRALASPNFDSRPPGVDVDLLVLHNISLPPGQFGSGCIERLFANALDHAAHPFLEQLSGIRVSAHFLIECDGRITQFVGVRSRAWHAGESAFEGRRRCNDFSVGIEMEGTDFTPFMAAQYAALARLTGALRADLALRAVRGHQHIAGGRKTDPGPLFDWARYAREADLPPHWLPPPIG